jgi:hypothetical protein
MRRMKESINWADKTGVLRAYEAAPGKSRRIVEKVGSDCTTVFRRFRESKDAPETSFETIEIRAADLAKLNHELSTAQDRVKVLEAQLQTLQRFKNSVEAAIGAVNSTLETS